MDKEDVKRLAKTPGLISGIYNYCDRWCERCPYLQREARLELPGAKPHIEAVQSIGAWGVVREHCPEATDGILDILVHLERLRKGIEKAFPDARTFRRPGFDYMLDEVADPA